mmetsp:Transcript_6533/g.10155  ORF Transcript_6533/g.10155 Transcript_6533/m.10155 type:complete len:258 (+) Transcript_6533:171-944(+)
MSRGVKGGKRGTFGGSELGVEIRGQVVGGVLLEETNWLQVESNMNNRHDWKVLRTGHVYDAHGVPQDKIFANQIAVCLGPLGYTGSGLGTTGVLIREFTGAKALVGAVGGDKKVLLHECSTLHHTCGRGRKRQSILAGHQFPCDWNACPGVHRVPVHHLPVPSCKGVDLPLGLLFRTKDRLLRIERIPLGIRVANWLCYHIHLMDFVFIAVRRHVNAEIQKVLMNGRIQVLADHCAMSWIFAITGACKVQHARELGL